MMTDQVLKDGCITNAARIKKRSSECDKISEPVLADTCRINIAIEDNDLSACADLEAADECYYRFAGYRKDIEICLSMSEGKDQCIYDRSWDADDRKWCVEIDDTDLKERCLSRTAGNVDDCEGLERHDECVYNLIGYGGAVDDCMQFTGGSKRWGCVQYHANENRNPETCDMIEVELRSTYCKETVNALIKKDQGYNITLPYHPDVNNPEKYE